MQRVSAIVVSYFTGPVLSRSIAALRDQPVLAIVLSVAVAITLGVIADVVIGRLTARRES